MQPVLIAVSALVSAACGAALGILFTVAHRATVPVGPIAFPYGIVLGLVSIIAFLIAMRLLWGTRWPAVGGALGVVVAIAVLSFAGPGGSVIVGDDAYGWTWILAPPLASAAIVAWPRRRRPPGPEAQDAAATMEGPAASGLESAEERS
ncbi:MAG: hypothetical protein BGO95_08140 [Micrococcales bacterium 73-13]|nr:MAG: hypothetical protein BGO95_08140 [Micrococcales bacterium 73-13]